MDEQALSLSLIIPAYNEEHHLRLCLQSVARQTIKPLEVIVVDNNSTDQTSEVARSFPFVTLISEKTQGLIAARNCGFNYAKGDILGRIDADSIVMTNWVETVLSDFSSTDTAGLTGLAKTNFLYGFSNFYIIFWSRVYFWTVHSLYRANTMWGANMAVRRSVWQEVKNNVNLNDKLVHEDQDLSLTILSRGLKINQDNKLLIKTSGRDYLYWPKLLEYIKRTLNTKKIHDDNYSKYKLSAISIIPISIIGWSLSTVGVIYSLICWPFLAVVKKLSRPNSNYFR